MGIRRRKYWTSITLDPSPPGRFRVEHHDSGRIRCLGSQLQVFGHFTALDPYLSDLRWQGAGGVLLLIDETTGRVVARRVVEPPAINTADRVRKH